MIKTETQEFKFSPELEKLVDIESLRRELKKVAAIERNQISRRERERLLVRTALSFLPENQRLIVYLRYWENQTLEEIAEMLDLPRQATITVYLLALAYLERELRPYVLNPEFFLRRDAEVA